MFNQKYQPTWLVFVGIMATGFLAIAGNLFGAEVHSAAIIAESKHLGGHTFGVSIIFFMLLATEVAPKAKKAIEATGNILITLALMYVWWEVFSHEHSTPPTYYWGPLVAGLLSFCANLSLERCVHSHTHHNLIHGLCTFARSHMWLAVILTVLGIVNLVYEAHWLEEVAKWVILLLISYNIFKMALRYRPHHKSCAKTS